MQSGYVLDTDAILNLTRRVYPSDVFPGLHKKVGDLMANELVVSSVEVLGELGINPNKGVEQWISSTEAGYPPEYNLPIAWAQKNHSIFLEFDSALEGIVNQITSSYNNVVKTRSTSGYDADVHLIALAHHRGWAVVTSEKASNNQDKPKIPDICRDLNIVCVDLLEMFKMKKWLF